MKWQKMFPEKSILLDDPQNNPVEITFSSFEEAEWKLLNEVSEEELFVVLVKVLMSDPSSMDYSFDNLAQKGLISTPVVSEDGQVRFVGVSNDMAQLPPSLIVQYRLNGEVRVAGFESEMAHYYSLCPETVDSFKKENSTVYYVWGKGDPKNTWMGYRMRAYELDGNQEHTTACYPGRS